MFHIKAVKFNILSKKIVQARKVGLTWFKQWTQVTHTRKM